MQAVDDELRCQSLYRPERVSDLITVPVLRMLLLGFAAGLDGMPVALQDRHEVHDLWGEPSDRWCRFCKSLRREHGQDQACRQWDAKVAHILLGIQAEEYHGQSVAFRQGPFHCHAYMVDMAAPIHLAGRPFAVLHGGQVPPREDGWSISMRTKLAELLCAQPQSDRIINELIAEVDEARRKSVTGAPPLEKHRVLCEFAHEVEKLLEHLYQKQRLASEEAIIAYTRDALERAPRTDWGTWWAALSKVLAGTSQAVRADRMVFYMGSIGNRYVLEPKASSHDIRELRSLGIGPFWQAVRHCPITLGNQSWAARVRECVGLTTAEQCLMAPIELPVNSNHLLLGLLVCIGDEVALPGMSDFLGRLAHGLGRRVSTTSQVIELEETRKQAANFAAMSGHHVKSFLHAATTIAAGISYDIERLAIEDIGLVQRAAKLERVLEEAATDIHQLQQVPVSDIHMDCTLMPLDLLGVIDRVVPVAASIGEEYGIAVRWIARPNTPILLNLDDRYMGTALLAILENAVKYSFDNTEVRISARTEDHWAVLEISNLGIGVPPDKVEKVFDLGARARVEDGRRTRPGTGLGLPIARQIVISHGGTLELHSVSTRELAPELDDYKSHKVTAIVRLPIPAVRQASQHKGVAR